MIINEGYVPFIKQRQTYWILPFRLEPWTPQTLTWKQQIYAISLIKVNACDNVVQPQYLGGPPIPPIAEKAGEEWQLSTYRENLDQLIPNFKQIK